MRVVIGLQSHHPTMREEDLHYLGGMIDGEGSLYVSVEKSPQSRHGVRLRPRFQLTMTDKEEFRVVHELIAELAEEVDATVNQTEATRDCYKSGISGWSSLEPFLEEVGPYVRSKSEIVDLLMDAPWPVKGKHTTGEQILEIAKARRRIRELNADRESRYDYDTIRGIVDREASSD